MNFDKTGYQLTSLFPLRPSTLDDANHGNGSVQRESQFTFYFLKICISLKTTLNDF